MSLVNKKLAAAVLLFGSGLPAFGSDEGVPAKPAPLIDLGHGWAITNSMITGWVVSALIVALVLWLVGRPSILPSRGQAVVESLIEGLRDLFEPIVGKRAFPASFPLLVSFFVFILLHNWMGLLPGVGTIGWGHEVDGRFHVTTALIRPFTSDFNSTIALALISFGAWAIIVLKYAGPRFIIHELFGNKADRKETPLPLYIALSVIFLLVGVIEVFSIAIRPFTLSVRLFGNIFGGENLLHGTHFFFVFYFMELLVGLIQALVFTLLTSVYIGLICNHGDDHAAEGGAHSVARH
ncbi:MAG: ATP synthase F0 subunit A [Verrucomicrobia bacterium RIFCSPLOWO2_12_FULL_64_8]|nr:MAG: ATP synthase F0 subunit A [Verrucomicrobia bacterium RIFCSPLOWO2_12_FULL_64_8]